MARRATGARRGRRTTVKAAQSGEGPSSSLSTLSSTTAQTRLGHELLDSSTRHQGRRRHPVRPPCASLLLGRRSNSPHSPHTASQRTSQATGKRPTLRRTRSTRWRRAAQTSTSCAPRCALPPSPSTLLHTYAADLGLALTIPLNSTLPTAPHSHRGPSHGPRRRAAPRQSRRRPRGPRRALRLSLSLSVHR